jgi:hypothetical protein
MQARLRSDDFFQRNKNRFSSLSFWTTRLGLRPLLELSSDFFKFLTFSVSVYLSIVLFVYWSICLLVYLSIGLSVYWSICLSNCMYFSVIFFFPAFPMSTTNATYILFSTFLLLLLLNLTFLH